jgi:hypothetical protein
MRKKKKEVKSRRERDMGGAIVDGKRFEGEGVASKYKVGSGEERK